EFHGPIYKTVLQSRLYRFCDATDAFPFSVSKVNQLLSLFVTIVWVILAAWSLATELNFQVKNHHFVMATMSILTLVAALALRFWGETENAGGDAQIDHFYRRTRTYT